MILLKEAFNITEILQNISTSSLETIASFACLKTFKKKEHIFFDRDEVNNLYVVIEGNASLYKVNSLGDKKVIFIFGKGKLLNANMLHHLSSSINCELLEDSLILILPIKKILKVMEKDPLLSKSVIDSMALEIRRLYRQLKNTGNILDGEKKLAAKIFKLSRDYGKPLKNGIKIDLHLTVTYLAEMLGSRRETVSRHMKKLCDLNLISFKNNEIIVNDIDKLSDYFKSL